MFDTAIVAGVMAAKRTYEMIPFCHPLPLDNCNVEIEARRDHSIIIRCTVSVHHRTGVEMEALTGASVAALTIYDMCKALSHDIQIASVRLVEKTGGKRDFKRAGREDDMSAPLYGLVLAGGRSTRMGQDKAALAYHGKSQLDWAMDLIRPFVEQGVRIRARGSDDRPYSSAPRADRRYARRISAPSREYSLRRRGIPRPPGWYWPATCRFSMPRRSSISSRRGGATGARPPTARVMMACRSRCARSMSRRVASARCVRGERQAMPAKIPAPVRCAAAG